MSTWLAAAFLIMSMLSILSVRYYGRSIKARNSAMILARLAPVSQDDGSLYADSIGPKRLAKRPALQKALKNFPLVLSAAGLLDQAGVATTVAQLFAYMGLFGLCSLLFAERMGVYFAASFLIGLASSVLPIFYYIQQRTKRIAAFEAQLPQVLEMLTLYLRSGRSLPQAFVATADEVPSPANEELAFCAEAYRLGRPLPVALKILSTKFPEAMGLKLFAIAVSVLGQTGGNLVEVLDRIRKTLESNLVYVMKLRSLTGETRTSGTILSVLPGLFMAASLLGNPDYFNQFFQTTVGVMLLCVFAFLWGSGILWIRQMMKSRA